MPCSSHRWHNGILMETLFNSKSSLRLRIVFKYYCFYMILQISSRFQESGKHLVYSVFCCNHVHARNVFLHFVTCLFSGPFQKNSQYYIYICVCVCVCVRVRACVRARVRVCVNCTWTWKGITFTCKKLS